MAENKKPMDKFTAGAIALIFLVVMYFAYVFVMGIRAPQTSFNYSLGQFKPVKLEVVSAIKGFNACGSWPLSGVSLSSGRGNPFDRQSPALPQMAAKSSISCMPVTQ